MNSQDENHAEEWNFASKVRKILEGSAIKNYIYSVENRPTTMICWIDYQKPCGDTLRVEKDFSLLSVKTPEAQFAHEVFCDLASLKLRYWGVAGSSVC